MPQSKEQIDASNKKYREKNKERKAAYDKEYHEENKEQIAAYMKEYREENKEQIAASNKKYREKNKERIAAYKKEYHEENKEQIAINKKKNHLKSKYGMTLKDQTILLQKQDNKCKICLGEFSNITPNIDHCHTTNKVRGILCGSCNRGLGHFKDNIKVLTKAINYLQENK